MGEALEKERVHDRDVVRRDLERESLGAGAASGAALGSVVGLATSAAFGPLIGAAIGAVVGAGVGHFANSHHEKS
jgi:uncharacterized membrane protein